MSSVNNNIVRSIQSQQMQRQPGQSSQIIQISQDRLQSFIERKINESVTPLRNQVQTLSARVQQLQVQNQQLRNQNQMLINRLNPEDRKIFKALEILNRNNFIFFDLPKAAKAYCLLSKSVSQSILKKIPLISLIAGITFGILRFAVAYKKYKIDDDKKRAVEEIGKGLLEIGSGIASMFPGIGTFVSLGTDAVITAWDCIDLGIDIKKNSQVNLNGEGISFLQPLNLVQN